MSFMKLRHLAEIQNSNVDKVVLADELPVRLCNYVDVYRNDFITASMDFSAGSATPAEIKRFRLAVGDVIITKDSEDRHDIGVPAYVRQTADDLVCGYHLTMLRSYRGRTIGPFLFWALQAKPAREAFALAANGVTRYGLTQEGIKGLSVWVPDLPTQARIADFLHRETARIDALIALRDSFALKVLEAREAIVSSLLVGIPEGSGSGEERDWLSGLPAGARKERAKFHLRERVGRSETGAEELLTVSHLTGVTKRSEKDVNMFLAESNEGYKLVCPGDIVINTMWAWMGAMGVSKDQGLISPSYGVYMPISDAFLPDYLDLLVRSKPFVAEATRRSKGIHSSRLRLYPDAFLDMLLPIPSRAQQVEILGQIAQRAEREDALAARNAQATELLREYRAALITAAVTGQIDVDAAQDKGTVSAGLDRLQAAAEA